MRSVICVSDAAEEKKKKRRANGQFFVCFTLLFLVGLPRAVERVGDSRCVCPGKDVAEAPGAHLRLVCSPHGVSSVLRISK
jgi:hypothetical protein